ncbi:MAG: thioredoxin domain-containing protein [Polyangiaceae bacterium]
MEASPYLVQHGHNPVDWYPWGDEALTMAKREDKPILLSIGYSACHWCHVMERESFENEAIAAQMNRDFVCIKVDREERPDLDQVYQLVVQLMGRSGGWPLTVFLTPAQKPFFGGTYFPPVPKFGMPSFPEVLTALADAYREKRDEVVDQAERLTREIAEISSPSHRGAVTVGKGFLATVSTELGRRMDDVYGGFGKKPKFPNPMLLRILLRVSQGSPDTSARERAAAERRVMLALDKMQDGGIYDHLGGGFHRYSTDEKWLVPHFEKMLYDNALLLSLYADAYRAFGDASYGQTVREVADYILREMTAPDGAFYSTQDADSEGEEGRFFVWDRTDLEAALSGDTHAIDVARAFYGITDEGNFEETGKTVLSRVAPIERLAHARGESVAETEAHLARAKSAMLSFRDRRPKPFRDEKVLSCWNGLMIKGLAEAGMALGDARYVEAAARAMNAIQKRHMTREDGRVRLARFSIAKDGGAEQARGEGYLEDHACLGEAALALFDATMDATHLQFARALADEILRSFRDGDGTNAGASYFTTARSSEGLIVRPKDTHDSAVPSGSAVALGLLRALGALVGEPYASIAARDLMAAAAVALGNAQGFGQTLLALDDLVSGGTEVVVVGDPADARTRDLVRTAQKAYVHARTLLSFASEEEGLKMAPALAEGKKAADEPVAYVCTGRTCSAPISDRALLSKALLLSR